MKLFVVAAVLGVCLADRLDNKYLPPRGNAGAGGFGPGFGAAGAPGFGKAGGGFGGAGGAGGFGAGGAGGFGAGGRGAGGAGGYGGAGSGFGGAGAGLGGAGSGFGGNTQYSGNAYNAPAGGQYNARGGNSADAGAQILKLNSEVTAEGFSYDFETSNGIRADARGVATNGVQSQGSFAYKGDDGQDYSISYTADENGYQPQGAHLPTPPPIPEEILKSLEQNARDEAAGIVDDGTYRGEGAGAGNGYSSGPAGGYSGAGAGGFGGSGAGGAGSGFGAGGAGSGFGAGAGGFGGAGAGRGSGAGGFGGAASRQYLAPNAGGRGSGSGNFNSQTGYRY